MLDEGVLHAIETLARGDALNRGDRRVTGVQSAIAWLAGPENAIVFVCAIGGIAMFTSVLIWRTWCLRTEA